MTPDPDTSPRSRRLSAVATALVILLLGTAVGGVAMAADDFSDVPDSHPFHDDIGWLADSGVANGFPDGTYHPSDPVTRQAMAAFLRRLAGADPAVDPVVDAASVGGMTADELDSDVRYYKHTGQLVIPDGGTAALLTTIAAVNMDINCMETSAGAGEVTVKDFRLTAVRIDDLTEVPA